MGPIEQLRKQKNDLVLIILTALLFALGINLLTSAIIEDLVSNNIRYIVGAALVLISIFLIAKLFSHERSKIVRVRAAIGLNIEKDNVSQIGIKGYNFNNDFYEYLNGFLNENKAFKKIFLKGASNNVNMASADIFEPDKLTYHTIINSVIELVFLKQLDYHLNSYIVHNEIDEKNIEIIPRSALSAGVLRNKVLELVTRDIAEREAFLGEDSSSEGTNVIYTTGKRGAVYYRIDLELPKGSTLSRNTKGNLEVENRLFKMTLVPGFQGFSTVVSNELIENDGEYKSPKLASFKILVEIKNVFIVSNEELVLFSWLDSFLERIIEYASVTSLESRSNVELVRLIRS